MISTLEKEVTFRFLKTRKKDGFLNIISIFSFIGISLGVAVLIIVMSVMNGFRIDLLDKLLSYQPHISVQSKGNYYNERKIILHLAKKNKIKINNINIVNNLSPISELYLGTNNKYYKSHSI